MRRFEAEESIPEDAAGKLEETHGADALRQRVGKFEMSFSREERRATQMAVKPACLDNRSEINTSRPIRRSSFDVLIAKEA